MDVYCPKCGEPVELDYFHDVAADTSSTYSAVRDDFARRGCAAIGGRCNDRPDEDRALAAAALFEIMGDDADGVAAMLEDAESMGLFG